MTPDRGNLYNFSDALKMLAFRRQSAGLLPTTAKRIRELRIMFNLTDAQWRLFQREWKRAQQMYKKVSKYSWDVLGQTHDFIFGLIYDE